MNVQGHLVKGEGHSI